MKITRCHAADREGGLGTLIGACSVYCTCEGFLYCMSVTRTRRTSLEVKAEDLKCSMMHEE